MWVAFYHTEIQNESSKNAENWFTNVSALKIEKSKIRHSPLAHIHQWVERPHGVTGGCVGSLHWPILTINFSPNIFWWVSKTKLFTFSSMTLLDERDFNFCWIFNIFSTRVVTHCTQTQQHATSYNVIRSFANLLVRRVVQIFFIDVQKCTAPKRNSSFRRQYTER